MNRIFENWKTYSVLQNENKVLEWIIFDRIQNYLNAFEILPGSQYGFRHGNNAIDAIAILIEEKRSNLPSNSDKTKCSFLDIKESLDFVDLNIFLQSARGLKNNILK